MLVRLYLRVSFFFWGFFFCLSDWIYMRIFIFVVLRLDERSAWQTTSVKSVRRGRGFSSVVQLSFLCGTTSMAKKTMKKKKKKKEKQRKQQVQLQTLSFVAGSWPLKLPSSAKPLTWPVGRRLQRLVNWTGPYLLMFTMLLSLWS